MDKESFLTNFANIVIKDSLGNPTPFTITIDITDKPEAATYQWLADNVICIYKYHSRIDITDVNMIVKSMNQDFINQLFSQCFPTTKKGK